MDEEALENSAIDIKRARFPYCIVWTPLPIVSWLIPFIGHLGICRGDGVVLDFTGPSFVNVDNFAFGKVARYIQLNKEQCCCYSCTSMHANQHQHLAQGTEQKWDEALQMSVLDFQHRSYNLFTCNCCSFVANAMNRVGYAGQGGWNVVNMTVFMFFNGSWVDKFSIARSFLPFVVVLSLGIWLSGLWFIIGLACLSFLLVGWFICGTYCCNKLVEI